MQLSFLGQNYPLKVFNTTINSYKLVFNYSQFVLTAPVKGIVKSKLEKVLIDWYKAKAKVEITNLVNFYIDKLGVNYNRIVLKNTKTRWGSCSSKGNLNFNYNLIKMPKDILDYVVIHEVCHLKHLNHSKEYWQLVKTMCPDYKEKIKWIKLNGGEYIVS